MILRLSVGVSLIALLALAGLQYYWVGQMAVAERQRLERSVAESSDELAEDFFNELRSLAMMLEPRPQTQVDAASIAARHKEWVATATWPALLKNLYLTRGTTEVLLLDPASGTFKNGSWPPELSGMGEFVARRGGPVPLNLGADALLMPLDRPVPPPPGRGGMRGPGGRSGPPGGRGRGPRRGLPPEGRGFPDGPGPLPPPELQQDRWLVAELNHEVLVKQILPALVELRFPDYEAQDYRIAVISRRQGDVRRTVFTSGGPWSESDMKSPDYQMDLLAPPLPRRPAGGLPAGPPPGERGGTRGSDRPPPRGTRAPVGLVGQEWRILVKHRSGSVEIAAAQFRNRNLAISFGVLVVLGFGTIAMLVSGSRARRLGKLQMEFAAGVSHELRTPLAVIQSAAHNLGAGIVQDREGIVEYAAIVQAEARRLSDMVEQVMTYTETQSGRKRYELAAVDVTDVVDIALRNMSIVLREGSATVQKRIAEGLPPVMADGPALTRCLQNLLSNAVKYGRSNYSAQIDIEAKLAPDSPGKVEISVIDQGLGVPEGDINHLFEAFHRGANVSTTTPGNGLGLHLVYRIMEAQHGSVKYTRTIAGGAKFTLTLPKAI